MTWSKTQLRARYQNRRFAKGSKGWRGIRKVMLKLGLKGQVELGASEDERRHSR